MRLFAAAWPSPAVRATLASLPRPPSAGLRWTTAEQWHVTLAFYGEVDDRDVPGLGEALGEAARSVPRIPEAALGGRTRRLGRGTLCLPVSGLGELAAAVRRSSRRWAGDEGSFVGHLTLARCRRGRAVPEPLTGQRLGAVPRWAVEEICLVASETAPAGARYRTVATAPVGHRDPPANTRSPVQCGDRHGHGDDAVASSDDTPAS